MRRNTAFLLTIILAAGATSGLHAQGRDRGLVELGGAPLRSGMYITLGVGDGMDQYKFQDLDSYSDWLSSPAAVLRIGGTVNQNVRIGAELFGWWHSYYNADPTILENETESFTAVLLDGQFYPAVRSGFYLKGGLGFGRSAASYEFDPTASNTGFVWSVGAGYDIPLSRTVSLSPTVDFYQGSFGPGNDPTSAYTEHVLNIGASLTFQSRRRRF
jgi:hypothetical protein